MATSTPWKDAQQREPRPGETLCQQGLPLANHPLPPPSTRDAAPTITTLLQMHGQMPSPAPITPLAWAPWSGSSTTTHPLSTSEQESASAGLFDGPSQVISRHTLHHHKPSAYPNINGFTHYLTLFPKYFSSFPHGTCSLSVSCLYLALDDAYHPF